jgi:hypothetical protein
MACKQLISKGKYPSTLMRLNPPSTHTSMTAFVQGTEEYYKNFQSGYPVFAANLLPPEHETRVLAAFGNWQVIWSLFFIYSRGYYSE